MMGLPEKWGLLTGDAEEVWDLRAVTYGGRKG